MMIKGLDQLKFGTISLTTLNLNVLFYNAIVNRSFDIYNLYLSVSVWVILLYFIAWQFLESAQKMFITLLYFLFNKNSDKKRHYFLKLIISLSY